MTLVIRPAKPGDEALVLAFIYKLAVYEKLEDKVVATEDQMRHALFDAPPRCQCDLAFWEQSPAGFAFWYYDFSTFLGRAGIYLEDLFVDPHLRGRGIGKGMMQGLARRCLAEDLTGLHWSVLNWNEPSIQFYKSLGASPIDEWTGFRLTGEALKGLAG